MTHYFFGSGLVDLPGRPATARLSFNEVAKILKDHEDVEIVSAKRESKYKGLFIIDASEAAIESLSQRLPDWYSGPSGTDGTTKQTCLPSL